jgi:hypothetical protein
VKLLIVATLAVLGVAGTATVMAFAGSAKPPLSQEEASRAENYLKRAITSEQRAINALDDHKILTASKEAKLGTVYINETSIALGNHDVGDNGLEENLANQANALDRDANRELLEAQKAKGKHQDALIKAATRNLKEALVFKEEVRTFFENYTPPEETTTTEPAPGPLTVCMFITNNGSTSTESAHVRDPNAGGASGTVTFNGQGLNQTNPITLDAGGSVITSFTVSTFGTATINAMVGPQSASTTFTLNSSTDNNSASDCP